VGKEVANGGFLRHVTNFKPLIVERVEFVEKKTVGFIEVTTTVAGTTLHQLVTLTGGGHLGMCQTIRGGMALELRSDLPTMSRGYPRPISHCSAQS